MSKKKRKRGEAYLRPDGLWMTTWRKKSFYGHTPEEAEKRRDDYRAREARGLDPDKERVCDYADDWLPVYKRNLRPKSMDLCRRFVTILKQEVGEKTFPEIKPSDVKRIYTKRFADASDSHIRHFKNLCSAIFESAVEDGYCMSNPWRSSKAQPHRGTVGTHRSITLEERDEIHHFRFALSPVVFTMLYAGLRDSEALAIDVGRDVDFDKKIIHVQYFRHLDGNRAFVDKTGKTPGATRDIPLFPQLEEILKPIPGLLAYGKDGKVLTQSGWHSAWKSYVTKMESAINGSRRKRWYGLTDADKANPPPPWREFKVRPYDLRHSFCTWCRDAGVDMHVLQGWMGHTDATMISKIYDHVTDDRIARETEKLTILSQK